MNAINKGAPTVRRRYQRRSLNCKAALFKGAEVLDAQLISISEGGLLLSCPKNLEVNEPLELQFFLTEQGYLTLKGTIIYKLLPGEVSPETLYGLRYIGLEIFDKITIQGFIRKAK